MRQIPTRRAPGARATAPLAVAVVVLAASLATQAAADPVRESGQAQRKAGKPKKGKGQKPKPGPVGGTKKGPSAKLSRSRVPASGAWRSYVLDSPTPLIYPQHVDVRNTKPGNTIDNPSGLSAPDSSATTLTATSGDGPYEIVDLGRLTGGQVEVGVSGGTGVQIRVSYSEAQRFLGPGGDIDHGSQGRNDDPSSRSDFVPAAPGNYKLAGIRGAERYIRIQLADAGSAQIDYIRVTATHLRPTAADYLGHFLSSDDLLNRIWYAGAYTLNVDSYGDPARGNRFAVTDGAKHDRLIWLGDVPIEALSGYYTVRQMPALLRRTLQLFTCQQYPGGFVPQVSEVNVECPVPGPANGPPASAKGICTCVTGQRLPAYTAWFVVGVGELYRMTGDPRVAQWLPVVRRAVHFFQKGVGARGLFVTREGEINWHPPDFAAGEDADTNAVWVRALNAAAMLERQLGSPRSAHRYTRMAQRLAAALRISLYDGAAGAMKLNTLDPTGNHTQDANVQSVLAGVLRGKAANAALNFLGNQLATPYGTATGQFNNDLFMGRYISPFQSGWELFARFQYFRTGAALDLTRRLWGHMVTGDPGDTFWEKLTVDGGVAPYQSANADGSAIIEDQRSGETSLAHGWSSGPTAALSAYVLGMRPVAPGWKTWLVEPQPGDLDYAQGTVGTPRGKLASRWERDAGGRTSFRLTVKAPKATAGTVAVPLFGHRRTIGRDGRVVWDGKRAVGGAIAHRAGDYVRFFEPLAGTHTYAWSTKGS